MITIRGEGASAGVAVGPLYFYHRAKHEIARVTVSDAETEWWRFRAAQARAIKELGALAEKMRAEAGNEAALLFETHQMMAEDLDFEKAIETAIRKNAVNAEAAVSDVCERFAQMFAAMDDEYMRLRAADVKDVSDRILSILTGAAPFTVESDVPVILAADDLAPSETAQLDRSKILAFLTEGGSRSSHTAILARTMGIPAVVGVGAIDRGHAGCEIIVDGAAGVAVIEPDGETRARLLKTRDEQHRLRESLEQLKGKENVTRDGRSIRICCNIGSPEDVRSVLENDGGGIGLFRSEFLYFGCNDFPGEEEQFEAYRKVLADMQGRKVVVRTLDVGADKQLDYLRLPKEKNPAMGSRGLRVCLTRPDVFRTQLRALYRASAFGSLGIMFPMVTSVWEVREARRLCTQVCRELDDEGVAHAEDVPLGVMIETPAAAMLSDRLAKEADFFSCGTNDLAQYTLACDRQNGNLGRFYDPRHPAVLSLLKLVAENAHKNGIPVGVCGEIGADPELTEFFLAIGVDELSVPPRAVLPLRRKVRETDVAECRARVLDELLGERNG